MELITSHPRWGDIDLDPERGSAPDGRARPADRRRRRPLLLRGLRGARGQAALGRQVPSLHVEGEADPAGAAGGAVHPPDPRRPRRGAVAERGELGAGRLQAAAAKWVDELRKARERAQAAGAPAPTWRSATRTWSPTPSPLLRRIADFVGLPWDARDARIPPRRRGADERGDPRLPADGRRDDHGRGAQAPARAGARARRAPAGSVAGGRRCQPRTARRSRKSPGGLLAELGYEV